MARGQALGPTVLAWLAMALAVGAEPQFDVQGPWGFWKRSNGPGDNPVTYFASVRSTQDPEVFFLIACEAGDVVTASLMHTQAFSYQFAEPIRLDLRLDNGPERMVTAALVQEM